MAGFVFLAARGGGRGDLYVDGYEDAHAHGDVDEDEDGYEYEYENVDLDVDVRWTRTLTWSSDGDEPSY